MCIRDRPKGCALQPLMSRAATVNNTVERKLREELEILKERQKGLDNLMNTKNKFDNEEIFYTFLQYFHKVLL